MKRKLIISTILICLIFGTGVLFGQTSQEEYNYVTKGYKAQVDNGLDMKKGYELKDIDEKATQERKVSLKVLYRLKETKKEIAAYMIIYTKKGNSSEYICVPHPKSDQSILDSYWKQLYDGSANASERLQLIVYLITSQISW